MLGTTVILSSCANGSPLSTGNEAPASTEAQTDSATADEQSSEELGTSDQTEPEKVISIGSKGKLNDWTFKINKVKVSKKIPNGNFLVFKSKKGKKFLQINMTVKNKGKSAAKAFPSYGYNTDNNAVVVYKEDKEFASTSLLGYSKDLHDDTVKPSSAKKGLLVYELPKKIASSKKNLRLKISAGDETIYFKLQK